MFHFWQQVGLVAVNVIGDRLDDPLDPNPVSIKQQPSVNLIMKKVLICIIYQSDHDNSQESDTTFSQGAP